MIERTKGGLDGRHSGCKSFSARIAGGPAPIRNLEGMKGQTIEVTIIRLNKKRGNIVVSRKELLEGP